MRYIWFFFQKKSLRVPSPCFLIKFNQKYNWIVWCFLLFQIDFKHVWTTFLTNLFKIQSFSLRHFNLKLPKMSNIFNFLKCDYNCNISDKNAWALEFFFALIEMYFHKIMLTTANSTNLIFHPENKSLTLFVIEIYQNFSFIFHFKYLRYNLSNLWIITTPNK